MKVRINIPNWIFLVVGLVLGGATAAWGIGRQLFENPATETNYANKIASGTPVPGYVPVAGYCTGTATGTGTTDRQCWKPIPSGLPTGTPGQVPQVANKTGTVTITATGTQTSATATATTTETEYAAASINDPMGTLFLAAYANEGVYPIALRMRSLMWGGQLGTGIYPVTEYSGTCSTGSDALLVTFPVGNYEQQKAEQLALFPGGEWVAKLRAKVNANGAAIRIQINLSVGEGSIPWFNWTTGVFANTTYQTIRKSTVQPESIQAASSSIYSISLYATCSTSTTVTVEINDANLTNRIESPVVTDPLRMQDVPDLVGSLSTLDTWKEQVTYGLPGQVVGYTGTGTDLVSAKGPVDREPVTSGVPGQVVCYTGTGTSTTTSKAACNQSTGAAISYYTGTVASVATSSGAGTSTEISRGDHRHLMDFTLSAQDGDVLKYITRTGTRTTTGTATATSAKVSANLTIVPAPLSYQLLCASTASDLTITSTSSVVSIGPFTPNAYTNRIRISAHWSGYATGGAATVVSHVRAVAGATSQILETNGVVSLASGYAADVTKYTLTWDADWADGVTFNLRIGTTAGKLLIPLNSQSSYYSACLSIEELKV